MCSSDLAEEWITERRTLWERRLDRLGDYLTETATNDDKPKEGTS